MRGDYRTFINKSPHIFFTTDNQGNFLFVNETVKRITGFTPAELLKSSLQKIAAPEYQNSILELLQNDPKKKNIPPLEIELVGSNGNRIPLEIQIIHVDGSREDGAILQGIAREISERKRTREEIDHFHKKADGARSRLLSILDSTANVAIQGYTLDGKVVFWNKFSEKLFGYSHNEAKGKTLKELLLSEADEKEFDKYITSALQNNKPSPLTEWVTKTKAGEKLYVLGTIFPSIIEELQPMAIAMLMDITDAKRAKEKINEIYRQLERFSEISAEILSIKDEETLFGHIAQAVTEISDFRRVLISYFIDEPPYREIIGHKGIKKADLERVKKVKMPREKYLEYFNKGIKIGNNSCYIPHTLDNILDQKAVILGETSYPVKEGHWHKEDTLLVSMKDTKGQMIGIISVDESKSGLIPTEETVRPLEIFANLMSEVIQKHRLAKKINESEGKYRELVNNIKIGIFRATPDGRLLEANPSVLEMFGYTDPNEFLSLRTDFLYPSREEFENFVKEIEDKGFIKNKDFTLLRKDGTPFWASIISTAVRDHSGNTIYYDTVVEDITERKKLEDEVSRLSITDELTGLYNRRYYNRHLPQEIKTAERWRSALSLVMVDIDDFKQYNDKYLHLEGDKILRDTAQNISNTLRKEADWASRFGGDEFVIVLPGTNSSEAAVVAERIRKITSELKFTPKGQAVHITVSAGVATFYYSESKTTSSGKISLTNYEKIANELTNLADKALWEAKKTGKNKVIVSREAIELSRMDK